MLFVSKIPSDGESKLVGMSRDVCPEMMTKSIASETRYQQIITKNQRATSTYIAFHLSAGFQCYQRLDCNFMVLDSCPMQSGLTILSRDDGGKTNGSWLVSEIFSGGFCILLFHYFVVLFHENPERWGKPNGYVPRWLVSDFFGGVSVYFVTVLCVLG